MASSAPPDSSQTAAPPPRPAAAVRMFGRFQLLRLIGKSDRSMLWLAIDTRDDSEAMLAMPRVQPPTDAASEAWAQVVQRANRLTHPHLQPALEIGEHDYWPYVAYARKGTVTWLERLSAQGLPAADLAHWAAQALQGLAYAHEAGAAHRDLQPYMLLVDDKDVVTVIGLEVGTQSAPGDTDAAFVELRSARAAAVQDVLALGLIMHRGLAGQSPLDDPDTMRVVHRLPPSGSEIVRLPWGVPRPIPDPLRAIVNRATDRQERQRYRNARTFCRALEGWLQTQSDQNGGPLALLMDRLRTVGLLPANPGGTERAAKLALLEQGHTSDLAEIVLHDLALTFELLRMVNTAKVHGVPLASGDGPVLMVRRAIAMVGLDGVRRAAQALRPWPGPMNEAAAAEMAALIKRVKRAGRFAQQLRPAGYDEEVVYLVALLQNLGRLVVQYHFPDESLQIRKLMQATPGSYDIPSEPGMSAEAASYAVLGIDIEAAGIAVAKQWGLDESVQQMIRRLPVQTAVRHADSDAEVLRALGSCANELVDALATPDKPLAGQLQKLVQRYGRILSLTQKDLQEAVQGAPSGGSTGPAAVPRTAGSTRPGQPAGTPVR